MDVQKTNRIIQLEKLIKVEIVEIDKIIREGVELRDGKHPFAEYDRMRINLTKHMKEYGDLIKWKNT